MPFQSQRGGGGRQNIRSTIPFKNSEPPPEMNETRITNSEYPDQNNNIEYEFLLLRRFSIIQFLSGIIAIILISIQDLIPQEIATFFSLTYLGSTLLCVFKVSRIANLISKKRKLVGGWVYGLFCLWTPLMGGVIWHSILFNKYQWNTPHNSSKSENFGKIIGRFVGRLLNK